jgi:hypothetical protein
MYPSPSMASAFNRRVAKSVHYFLGVALHEGQEKLYHEAQASIHTPDRTLRITRNQDSIAEFQSEYYQYWEYVEETSAGTGEDTHTDTSVSG